MVLIFPDSRINAPLVKIEFADPNMSFTVTGYRYESPIPLSDAVIEPGDISMIVTNIVLPEDVDHICDVILFYKDGRGQNKEILASKTANDIIGISDASRIFKNAYLGYLALGTIEGNVDISALKAFVRINFTEKNISLSDEVSEMLSLLYDLDRL